MIGMQFGLNVVTEDLGQQPYGSQGRTTHKVRVKCLGGCNTERVVTVNHLKSGEGKGCKKCSKQTHGLSVGIPNTKEGRSLKAAISRSHDPNHKNYADYGQRGIYVCDRWRGEGGYEHFLADMGPRPKGTTLERKDYNDGYYKENCEWATYRVQANNRRNNRRIEIDGVTLNLGQWAEQSGVYRKTITYRLDERGWTPKQAVFRKPHSLDIPPDTDFRLMLLRSCPEGKTVPPVRAA